VKVPTIEAPRRVGDPPRLFAAPGLAERDLGWVATRSDIDRIVETAARWHRSNVFSEAV
jgi:UDP-glucose 4-epimerase